MIRVRAEWTIEMVPLMPKMSKQQMRFRCSLAYLPDLLLLIFCGKKKKIIFILKGDANIWKIINSINSYIVKLAIHVARFKRKSAMKT